jgi:hypothetical protein
LSYGALATGRHDQVRATMEAWRVAVDEIHADDFNRAAGLWTRAAFGGLFRDPEAPADARAAVRLARAIGNPTALANSLHALGLTLAQSAPAEALPFLEESLAVAPTWHSNLAGNAYALLAQLRARQGDRRGALDSLRSSIVHLDRIGDRPQLAGSIDWGISILGRFGEPEPAAVFVGIAVEGALASINNFPGAPERRDDEQLGSLVTQLGPERYGALVDRGASMSYEQAVEFAVAELDELLAAADAPGSQSERDG